MADPRANELVVEATPIPGLLVVRMPVHGDARGWFKENWQREKMVALGLPDFGPVQNNISFNAARGATRGIHTEPWDKYVSLATGRIFGAWVDMRQGETFGTTFTLEMDTSVAVFVPRGVGNSYQVLEDATAYSCHGHAATASASVRSSAETPSAATRSTRSASGYAACSARPSWPRAPTTSVLLGGIGTTPPRRGLAWSFSEISASSSGIGHGMAADSSPRWSAG